MLDDARTVPRDKTIETDLCIVGAGPAGITIARELAHTGMSVLLLESGGFEFDQKTQDLYAGEAVGQFRPRKRSYVSQVRLRYFGGSTNHWTGWCRASRRRCY